MTRTIIFGDIHACHEEWQDLMNKIGVRPSDRLIAAGDLCCKGPSTVKTLELAMGLPNCTCILGNHDYYLLKNWQADCLEELTGPHRAAIEEMGSGIDRYMNYIASWPFYLNLDECIVVHGGLRPGLPLEQQDPHDLLHLRTIEPENRPWYELYRGEKTVVFGHWAKKGLVVRPNAIGLDTGCVYGRELSAWILPERRIESVRARRVYAS